MPLLLSAPQCQNSAVPDFKARGGVSVYQELQVPTVQILLHEGGRHAEINTRAGGGGDGKPRAGTVPPSPLRARSPSNDAAVAVLPS